MLRHLCDECGFDNLPAERFCGGCGRLLSSDPESLDPDALDPADPPDDLYSPSPNRLAALRAELVPAITLTNVTLSDVVLDDDDVAELDEAFIHGEP